MGKKKYYNNGLHEKRFELDAIIPEGWVPGRICSSATTAGCIWINNGIEAKFIPSTEPIPNGWSKGRLKTHFNRAKSSETWKNKHYKCYTNGVDVVILEEGEIPPDEYVHGRPKLTDEHKTKLSVAHTGFHHTNESKRKISEHSNNNREKAYETIINEYGSLDNYYAIVNVKRDKTKAQNSTYNTSKPEKLFYTELCESYGKHNILRQYKEERYPFHCDFYIKSEDLFIELNAHWTHGGRPYDATDEECQNKLAIWQEKAKTSQFYANAIQTWTERDVEKQRIANENNLNYKVIYEY